MPSSVVEIRPKKRRNLLRINQDLNPVVRAARQGFCTVDIDDFCRSTVVCLIKSPESSLRGKITGIHALDEEVSNWWHELRPDFKLTPSNIGAVPEDALPKLLLLNIVYHQSLCALHASIVPLFCWSAEGGSWSPARQLSAQTAFEHACAASALIDAVLSTYVKLSAMPGFVAYAAYCGCAIQIPFMWCLNASVKERARANVRANVRMIHIMAGYWKVAALLVSNPHRGQMLHLLMVCLISKSMFDSCSISTRGIRRSSQMSPSTLTPWN